MSEQKQGKSGELRSALDIALERLGAGQTFEKRLSEEQRKAIAEIERNAQAKIAEIEILLNQSIAAARRKGDYEEAEHLEERKRREIAEVRARAEEDKERIRQGQG